MNFYQRHIEPAVVSFACGLKPIAKQREKIAPRARGVVLEVGFGSGLNLPFYDASRVEKLFALEPDEAMRRRAARRLAQTPIEVELIGAPGEEIPLPDQSVDSILITYTMCTIPDVARALAGMRRVLKPGGELYFCEHGRAPDPGVARWQDRLNGVWGALAGGCRLNRDIPAILKDGGFALASVEEMYLPGTPKIAGYNYWGTARPA
ncbi:MAG: methyltransferase domain-containing protein [Alphaproteobacteria bacterium]|nr:methyltransferase domain-containing protein [Alphaproteobacteria bacterium]